MLGRRGKTWLSAIIWLLLLTMAFWPAGGNAAEPIGLPSSTWNLPIIAVTSQTPLDAQMTTERPAPPSSFGSQALLQKICPGVQPGSTLQLPHNFRISFRYHGDTPTGMAERLAQPPLLFRYSMDYCLRPNLQVGLSGFLYQPPADHLTFLRPGSSDLILGWGPAVKYDLGRWSFTFRSQLQSASPEGSQDLQNWFRVWYAF